MARRNRRPLYNCKNCGTQIVPDDAFCRKCGQENHDHHLTMKAMLYEFVEGITHFDNKVINTYKNLIFKPGKLTKEYIEGKRVSYVPPVRLYIFTAFVYFFLMGLMVTKITEKIKEIRNDNFNDVSNSSEMINVSNSNLYQIQLDSNEEVVLKILKNKLIKQKDSLNTLKSGGENAYYLKNLNQSLAFCNLEYVDSIKIVDIKRDTVKVDVGGLNISGTSESAGEMIKLSELDSAFIEKNGIRRIVLFKKPVYDTVASDENFSVTLDVLKKVYFSSVKTDSLIKANQLGFFSAKKWKPLIYTAGINRIGTVNDKDRLFDDIGHKFTKYSSFAMYLMMPISALLLWMFFYRKEKLYFPNFLFSMHVQTANFIFLIIGVGLVVLFQSLHLSEWFPRIVILLLFLLLLIYFYKAVRFFYQESILKTIWKLAIISLIYSLLFSALIYGIGMMAIFN